MVYLGTIFWNIPEFAGNIYGNFKKIPCHIYGLFIGKLRNFRGISMEISRKFQ